MPVRALPDDEHLAVLLTTHTRKQIAATYGVSSQAVSNRIARKNLPTPRSGMLPWPLRGDHGQQTEAQYLRALARQARGTANPTDRTLRSAKAWAHRLANTQMALTYNARRGFVLVPYDQVASVATVCIAPTP